KMSASGPAPRSKKACAGSSRGIASIFRPTPIRTNGQRANPMCGIADFFDIESRQVRSDGEDLLLSQIYACQYRGPDAKAVWDGPGIGLAHARLAIIDLSESANQPMFSED